MISLFTKLASSRVADPVASSSAEMSSASPPADHRPAGHQTVWGGEVAVGCAEVAGVLTDTCTRPRCGRRLRGSSSVTARAGGRAQHDDHQREQAKRAPCPGVSRRRGGGGGAKRDRRPNGAPPARSVAGRQGLSTAGRGVGEPGFEPRHSRRVGRTRPFRDTLSTSQTLATAASLRVGDMGRERIRSAARSVTGRLSEVAVGRARWQGTG